MWFLRQLPESLIRRLARWRSEIINIYLESRPVAGLGIHSFVRTGSPAWKPVPEDAVVAERLLSHIMRLLTMNARPIAQPQIVKHADGNYGNKKVVCRIPSKPARFHTIAVFLGPPDAWRCHCGFAWGKSSHVSIEEVDDDKISELGLPCSKGCFKHPKPFR